MALLARSNFTCPRVLILHYLQVFIRAGIHFSGLLVYMSFRGLITHALRIEINELGPFLWMPILMGEL